MTKLLEKAITEIRRLPDKRQDEAAEMLLTIVSQEHDGYVLSSEQIADLETRLSEPPDYATDEDVEAVIKRLTR
jgi:hypothetical protein